MKESAIEKVTDKLQKLKISKLPRDKKYLISQETRKFIKDNNTEYLGILPIKSTPLQIYNPKKEFFLHQTEILTYQKQMICLPVSKSKKSKTKIIQDYLLTELNIKIPKTEISKILDVENSKIQVYLINLKKYQIITEKESSDDLVSKLEKLSLDNNIILSKLREKNYTFEKILDFYNQIEVRDSIRELYQNIGRLKQNNYRLQKCISMSLPATTYNIQFKYGFIYSRLT